MARQKSYSRTCDNCLTRFWNAFQLLFSFASSMPLFGARSNIWTLGALWWWVYVFSWERVCPIQRVQSCEMVVLHCIFRSFLILDRKPKTRSESCCGSNLFSRLSETFVLHFLTLRRWSCLENSGTCPVSYMTCCSLFTTCTDGSPEHTCHSMSIDWPAMSFLILQFSLFVTASTFCSQMSEALDSIYSSRDLCRKLRACFQSALRVREDFSIYHLSGFRLIVVHKLVLRPVHVQEDIQSECSVCSACLRRNCSDNLWRKSRRICSFGVMPTCECMRKIHHVAVLTGKCCQIWFPEVFLRCSSTLVTKFGTSLTPADNIFVSFSSSFDCDRPLGIGIMWLFASRLRRYIMLFSLRQPPITFEIWRLWFCDFLNCWQNLGHAIGHLMLGLDPLAWVIWLLNPMRQVSWSQDT